MFSVHKTKIPVEYREKDIRSKYLKYINFFDSLSIQDLPFDEYSNSKHFHLTIITESLRGRSLLKNSKLITLHFTVL